MKSFRWLVAVPLVAFVAWFFLGGELATEDATTDQANASLRTARDAGTEHGVGARLAGELLVDSGFPIADVFVRCTDTNSAAGSRAQATPAAAEGRGVFALEGLPAGKASVEFGVRNGPVLVRIDGVELVPGEACADPRLAEVDLRGLAKSVHVVIRDEGGEGINHSIVRARGRDGSVEWSRVTTDDGHATVRASALPIDFVLGASGYRTERVDGASEDFEVRLARGLAVELVPDPELRALLGADATLAVVYERGELTTPDDAITWPELAKPDAAGVATVRVCEPGRFRAELRASRRCGERNETFSAPCSPATIDVRDSDEPQRFEITLPETERARLRAFREP
ncbi:MAG: hypothetical protein HZA52_17840 [Planctomycetes bacterium]|nr:hypothetical protein [Planctomycetota bacterium]